MTIDALHDHIANLQQLQPWEILELDEATLTARLHLEPRNKRTGKPNRHIWRTLRVDETGHVRSQDVSFPIGQKAEERRQKLSRPKAMATRDARKAEREREAEIAKRSGRDDH